MRATNVLLLLVLCPLVGCGLATRAGSGKGGAAPDDAEPTDLSATFVLGCGPTRTAPAELAVEGHETLGCAIFSRGDGRRVVGGFELTALTLTVDGEEPRREGTTVAPADSVFVAFFHLPLDVFPRVTRIVAEARLFGEHGTLSNDGLVVFDPEGLSDKDATANSFVVVDGVVPPFAKPSGHFLIVTEAALLPGADFHSLAGADYRCSVDAQRVAKLAILRWRALLSDEQIDARGRTALEGPLRNATGDIMLDDAATLFSAPDLRHLAQFPSGAAVPADARVWTGSSPDGARRAGQTCLSWASKAPEVTGGVGHPDGIRWVEDDIAACDLPRRLYCISH